MEKRWVIASKPNGEIVNKLAKDLNNMPMPLAEILVNRGIDSFDKAKHFFRPSMKDTHDPFLMKDMDTAVNRLTDAIHNHEKILVYGDYDVDGTSSVALVYSFLKKYYDQLDFYIPDRYNEGYGISYQGIDYAAENNIGLIIALDCGIKAIEKIDYANDRGIDFIICDHHTPGENLPKAIAVLDPKRSDCAYPYKELSACGVGYKFMHAFCIQQGIDLTELEEYLDLLAISICADIVPITGENRIFTYYGLEKINTNPRPGISQLMSISSEKTHFTSTDIVFKIAPRINAAGRIESGKRAVEVLISDNVNEALKTSKHIDAHNTERRAWDKQITEEALGMIELDGRTHSTVLYKEDWHKGVIGIVASRLIETHYKPTIILTLSNGKVAGSARSVSGFSVYDAIDKCAHLLEQFGGHKYAAGLTLPRENVTAFRELFEEIVATQIEKDLLVPQIEIDVEITLDEIDGKFFRLLDHFEPCGPENMTPVFVSRNLNAEVRIVGETHLKLSVWHTNNPSVKFPAIAFGMGHLQQTIARGTSFDMVYTITENQWNGVISLQLMVKDIKLN